MLQMLLIFTMLIPSSSVYDYSIKTIDGKEVKLSDFKGKTLVLVNTASKCGFTKQYKDLQALHEQHGDQLVIIGFPSDNFGGQELDENEDIQAFCEENYGVTFILSEKVDVKGDKATPLFKYLTSAPNSDFTGDIKWNFEKFVINPNGQLVHRFRSAVSPSDQEFLTTVLPK
ncbi:glutathione peroxidase [Sphingobacterium sp. lm-10]|uniref:glutathione peroxidase n=1 Tax=Sphingobacterium sp. lm-10 TaxID=2944904 RepID=UPI00201FE533|nr:glutathione peroxidase [Sphingobacterium sp. lm-10]MCL7989332.1 glutathione peroxidase [Sphingobacterium sp. lm-10]